MDIHIIGGCYREICHWPQIDQVYGSGGRAAEVISQMSQQPGAHLHSSIDPKLQSSLEDKLAFLKCKTSFNEKSTTPVFEYDHPLAQPKIHPSRSIIEKQPKLAIELKVENALIFGTLDIQSRVQAKKAVYDPQCSISPIPFLKTENSAENLALVVNHSEALSMYKGIHSDSDINTITTETVARALLDYENADVIVVKCGQKGAFVQTKGECAWVPAYKTKRIFPIGSGDCFAAAFSYFWIEEVLSPIEAATKASVVTAFYVESRTYPSSSMVPDLLSKYQPLPINKPKGRVYLAGAFFNLKEMWLVNQAYSALQNSGMDVFSPYHDVGPGPSEEVVHQDIKAIEECDCLYALFDGKDPGTLFEIGYAIKCHKPVVIYSENSTEEELKMYEGTGCIIHSDFSSSIYHACWCLDE